GGDGSVILSFAYKDVMINCGHGNGKVAEILVVSPSYKTAEGIGVGSTIGDVVAKYGQRYGAASISASEYGGSDHHYEGGWYSSRGIWFVTDEPQTIFVEASGGQPLKPEALRAKVTGVIISEPF